MKKPEVYIKNNSAAYRKMMKSAPIRDFMGEAADHVAKQIEGFEGVKDTEKDMSYHQTRSRLSLLAEFEEDKEEYVPGLNKSALRRGIIRQNQTAEERKQNRKSSSSKRKPSSRKKNRKSKKRR